MTPDQNRASPILVGVSLVALYFIWGSTYLAIRIGLTGFPPILMAALRQLAAGVILFSIFKLRGAPWPTRAQWRGAFVTGTLLLTGGNGLITLAERSVDSSFAAIALASMPLWVAVIGLRYGTRPTRREVVGLLVGFTGVIVLNLGHSIGGDVIAFVAVIASPILWAWGSVLSPRVELPGGALRSGAQMICGGLVLVVWSLCAREHFAGPPSTRSLLALGYLLGFGSLAGFTAYGYLLRSVRPAIATSYAYVNPIVAIACGVLLAHEEFSRRAVLATALTLGGVFILVTKPRSG